jgi:lysine decarboxylase
MSDQQYLVCILTCCDTQEDLDRLLEALKALPVENSAAEPILTPPPEPIFCQSIRSALFGPREFLPLFAAKGRISAQILAPYPPGIPVVAPGEEITEKHIAYLQKKSYNIEEEIAVTRHPQYKGGTP